MTLSELIERLEELRDEVGENAEVRIMSQPNWPFENSIKGLTTSRQMNEQADPEDVDVSENENDPEVVFIVEGSQLGYGSKNAWNCC